jgi:hypothetical protein
MTHLKSDKTTKNYLACKFNARYGAIPILHLDRIFSIFWKSSNVNLSVNKSREWVCIREDEKKPHKFQRQNMKATEQGDLSKQYPSVGRNAKT